MALSSTREAAMLAIQELAREDERIVVVSPDAVAAARATKFREEFPNRVIEVGIAEQDAVDIAAGLASTGMRPVVVSYAGFLTMRACEMIRTFVAYPGLNVKFIGLNGGMLGGEREGVTHQFYEDVGILRSMPGVKILTPADGQQAYLAARAMMETDGPCYLRLGSGREPQVFEDGTPFTLGKVREVRSYGNDVALFASGFIMDRAIAALDALHADGVNGTLVDVSTIKPIDAEGVASVLKRCSCAVTVEDHNIYGGLGDAVCEVACRLAPCRVLRVGLKDVYPRSGKAAELLDAYGLSVADIVSAARDAADR